MALIEPQNPINPDNLKFFTSDEYKVAVNQSIQSLLESLQHPSPDLSALTSTFHELMQAKPNPLLESIWFFSGLTFHEKNSTKDDILDQVSAVKALFQSITGHSASCSSSTSIALIAPVIFKLHGLIVESKRKEVDSKRGKKARREIIRFLDVILGYFNLCSDKSNSEEDSALVRPLIDLVSIWVPGESTENRLKQFFPLLSDEIISWVTDESGRVLELLAGAVISEAFMLKLCLQFSEGSSTKEVHNDLRTWAVCSITGFPNFYFFDMLIKMLLEPNLTVASLLNSEEELFMRKLLYDVVILPDYSFLHLDNIYHLPINHIQDNILARIFVTHEAIELFRKKNDHSKAILYTNAFLCSHLPTLVTKLVTSPLGDHGRKSQPRGSSPMAFIELMVELEGQGLGFSDVLISKYRERLALYCSRSNLGQPSGKRDQDVVFFIDNMGNDEEDEDEDENKSGKKRKEISVKKKKKDGVKFQRHERSGEKSRSFVKDDDSGSESEVEDPDEDEDDLE